MRAHPPTPRSIVLQLALALLSFGYIAAAACLLPRHYLVNDDTGIIGFITAGFPVPYEGLLLTSALHALYTIAPAVAWFGWMLYVLQWLCLYLWLMLIWRVCRQRWLAAAFSLLVLACDLDYITALDFTATAAMLCVVALAWAAVQAVGPDQGWRRFLGPGCVFVLGMLVRPDCVWGALAYLLPVALAVAVACSEPGFSWPVTRRLASVAAIFLLPAALATAVDVVWRHAAMDPAEARYEAFNSAGGAFDHLSRPRRFAAASNPALLQSIGWSREDFNTFNNWAFMDERIYTPEAMRKLADAASLHHLGPREFRRLLITRFPPYNYASLLLMAVLPLGLLLCLSGRLRAGMIVLLTPVYCISLTIWMYAQYSYHPRIEIPYTIGAGLAMLLLALDLVAKPASVPPGRAHLQSQAACLMLGFLAAWFMWSAALRKDTADHMARGVEARLQGLNSGFPDTVILMQPGKLRLEELDPLQPYQLKFHPVNFGWNMFSPRFYSQIRLLGIGHGYELAGALVNRPDAYILASRGWCRQLVAQMDKDQASLVDCQPAARGLFRLIAAH